MFSTARDLRDLIHGPSAVAAVGLVASSGLLSRGWGSISPVLQSGAMVPVLRYQCYGTGATVPVLRYWCKQRLAAPHEQSASHLHLCSVDADSINL